MKTFTQLKKNAGKKPEGLKKIKLALLGDTATQFLNTALKGSAIDLGFDLDIFEADFGQVSRQILDPSSDYYQFDADYT